MQSKRGIGGVTVGEGVGVPSTGQASLCSWSRLSRLPPTTAGQLTCRVIGRDQGFGLYSG